MPDLDIEGKLTLTFPGGWKAVKLDDEAWYRNEFKSQARAVDVVATHGAHHWWIEVKDCAGFEIANLPRFQAAEPQAVMQVRQWVKQQGLDKDVQVKRGKPFIVDELLEKFHGSMTCMVGAQRAQGVSPNAARLTPFMAAMSEKASLNLVLLLTWRGPDFKRMARLLKTKLEQRMAAFNVACLVVDEMERVPGQPWQAHRCD